MRKTIAMLEKELEESQKEAKHWEHMYNQCDNIFWEQHYKLCEALGIQNGNWISNNKAIELVKPLPKRFVKKLDKELLEKLGRI